MNSSKKGPKPRFNDKDLWQALRYIQDEGKVGRKKISDELGLGEGSTRTILKQLKKKGLISSTPKGHSVTGKGKEELDKRSKRCLHLDAGELTVGEEDVAVLVRGTGKLVRQGIEQRDEAIKSGAEGATVLIYEDGELYAPGVGIEIDEKVKRKIVNYFHPEDSDVIVIGTSEKVGIARVGALAAANSLEDCSSTKKPSRN